MQIIALQSRSAALSHEAMNAKIINANEFALYWTLALTLTRSRLCWQNQNHFNLQLSIVARACRRGQARASGRSMN